MRHVPTVKVCNELSNDEIISLNAKFLNRSHFKLIINNNCDCVNTEGKTIFHFRKNLVPENLCKIAYNSFVNFAKYPRANRGAAAGEIDIKNLPKYVGEVTKKSKTRVHYKTKDGINGKRAISNLARSAIAGFYDRKVGSAPECRLTRFTSRHFKRYLSSIPYVEHINSIYRSVAPQEHMRQSIRAAESPNFMIGNSCFSTLTLNYNWRTACHTDSGDYDKGLSVISVLGDDRWNGCEIGFPQYKIAVDVRAGDTIMDSHEIHCNTQFSDPPDEKGNADYERLSVVLYLRQQMNKCKGKPHGIEKIYGSKKEIDLN